MRQIISGPSVPPNDSITEPKIADGAVGTTDIADAAITNAKIATGAITGDKLATTLDSAQISDGAITEAKLASSAVTESKIGSGAVTADKLGSNAVTTAKVQDGAITNAKITSLAYSKLTGTPTLVEVSDGVPSALGSASAGGSEDASRADHVHPMPSASDVGAVPTARTVTASTGLTGGGALSSNISLAVDFAASGTTSTTKAVRADDSRLSDARAPTTHTHDASAITGGLLPIDRGGTGSGTAAGARAALGVPASTTTISAGTGLTGGGDLGSNRTLSLATTAVTPGSYTNANITVDAQGRITAAANGSGGGGGSFDPDDFGSLQGGTLVRSEAVSEGAEWVKGLGHDARVVSAAGPWNFADGDEFSFFTTGGTERTITINAADEGTLFADIDAITATELADLVNANGWEDLEARAYDDGRIAIIRTGYRRPDQGLYSGMATDGFAVLGITTPFVGFGSGAEPGVLTSGNTQNFVITGTKDLEVEHAYGSITATWAAGTYTAQDIVDDFNSHPNVEDTGVKMRSNGGALELYYESGSVNDFVTVTGGTANAVFDFPEDDPARGTGGCFDETALPEEEEEDGGNTIIVSIFAGTFSTASDSFTEVTRTNHLTSAPFSFRPYAWGEGGCTSVVVEIWNETDSVQVTGSEITISSTTGARAQADISGLSSGKVYKIRAKRGNAAGTAHVSSVLHFY